MMKIARFRYGRSMTCERALCAGMIWTMMRSLHAAEMTVLLSGQDDSEAEEWISAFIDAGAEVAAESLLPRAPTEEEIQVADQVSADLSVVIDWDQPVHEGLLRQLWDALLTKSVDESSRPPFEHQSVAWQQLLGFDSHDPTTTFNAQSGGGLAGLKWLIWYAEASPSRACASLQRLSEIQRLSQEGSKHSRERLQGPAFGERGLPWACAALQCFLWTCSEFRFIILGSLGVSLGAKRCWGSSPLVSAFICFVRQLSNAASVSTSRMVPRLASGATCFLHRRHNFGNASSPQKAPQMGRSSSCAML